MKVRDYVDRLPERDDPAAFAAAHPAPVLVEVEAQDQTAAAADEVTLTEQQGTGQIRRQTRSSGDAAVLVLEAGPDGVVTVGRAPSCAVVIDHASASKEHARFLLKPDGIHLEDLGSTNGTYHNHRRLKPRTPVLVRPDDSVAFGRATGFQLLDPDGFYTYLRLIQRFAL